MSTNQQIIEYIEACNTADAEVGFQLTDEKMAAHVAFVFMTPWQIFKVLLESLQMKYLS